MESVATILIGVGGLFVILSLLLGIVELTTLRTIRPPEPKTFDNIRFAARQSQAVFAPAFGALISGLFVSLSASFFYGSIISEQESWHQAAGAITFIAGAVALVVTLGSVLKDAGEPGQLARDPFTIRAAADESAANPRGSLDPDFLAQQLKEWEDYISARSMNLSIKADAVQLGRALTEAARVRGLVSSVPHSIHVYYAAFLRFPFRFGWPLFGLTLFMIGIVWIFVSGEELDFTASWRAWAKMTFFAVPGMMATIFYCMMRGNRARLWHRINLVARDEARKAIEAARSAHVSVAAEDELLRRVLKRADSLLQGEHAAHETGTHIIFRLRRIRVSVAPKSSSA